jgi:hypothetical protein
MYAVVDIRIVVLWGYNVGRANVLREPTVCLEERLWRKHGGPKRRKAHTTLDGVKNETTIWYVPVLMLVQVMLFIFLDSLTSVDTLWNLNRISPGYLEMVGAIT